MAKCSPFVHTDTFAFYSYILFGGDFHLTLPRDQLICTDIQSTKRIHLAVHSDPIRIQDTVPLEDDMIAMVHYFTLNHNRTFQRKLI